MTDNDTNDYADYNDAISQRIAAAEAAKESAGEEVEKPENVFLFAPEKKDEEVQVQEEDEEAQEVQEETDLDGEDDGELDSESDEGDVEEDEDEEEDGTPFATIKVNGEEHDVTREELIKLAQKGWSADEKFRAAKVSQEEGDRKTKAAEQIYGAFATPPERGGDPIGSLEQIHGVDRVRDMIEKRLVEHLEYDNLPESDRRALTAEQERDHWRQKATSQEEKERATAYQQQVEALERSIAEQTTAALKSHNLPFEGDEGAKMARLVQKKQLEEYDDSTDTTISAAEAVEAVIEDLIEAQSVLLEALPEGELTEKFGGAVKKIRKADLKRLKSKRSRGSTSKRRTPGSKKEQQTPEQKAEEYAKKRVDLPLFYD